MMESDDYYKAQIINLNSSINYMQKRIETKNKTIETLRKSDNDKKHCIDALSAELGKIKRKLKRQGG